MSAWVIERVRSRLKTYLAIAKLILLVPKLLAFVYIIDFSSALAKSTSMLKSILRWAKTQYFARCPGTPKRI
jgi:hypothetical protein